MAETENFCHRVRTKDNWDVSRFGRVKFLTRADKRLFVQRPQDFHEAGVYLFYRERQTPLKTA